MLGVLVALIAGVLLFGEDIGLFGTATDKGPSKGQEIADEKDSDGDGVKDNKDNCPNEGDQGYGVDENGCPNPPPPPPDSDGDGFTDDVDACPNQGDVGNGVDSTGCPYRRRWSSS